MKTKALLGVTGSVAAILTPKIVQELFARGCEVKIIATEKSIYFWNPGDVRPCVYRDRDEWGGDVSDSYRIGERVLHIELRDWADVLLIAPLTANTLAKLVNGLADNLLTSVARAWNPEKRMVLAPAMNTYMWRHPVTSEQLHKLGFWYPRMEIVAPVCKTLACGTFGVGALAEPADIADAVVKEEK